MEYITAPWRSDYVRSVCRLKGCIFCRALKLGDDRAAHILHRGKHNFVILNKFPYTPGHLMIAPFRHTAAFERASREANAELIGLLQLSLKTLKRAYHPHGFNAGINLGQSAGAGVVHHYHFHVIPRWHGDSNFMPLISGTRILTEDLECAYDRLLPLFQSDGRRPRRKR
ncbi:MAG: HIT domain-containing protein [Candidatus Aminicenantes bacterium]|nr:HIT domain-containing protein [Candidatus Aminicenantes bacterium]